MRGGGSGAGARVGRNLFWTFFSVVGEKLVFFAATVYLARSLGVEGFGVLTAAQAVAMGLWAVVDLGINRYGVREIARERNNAADVINQLLGMRMTFGALVFALLWAGMGLTDFSGAQKSAMVLCGVYLLSNALYTDWVFRGIERFKFITYGSFASSVFYMGAVLLFVRDDGDILKAAALWSGSYFLGSAILLAVLRAEGYTARPAFDLGKWMGHLRESVYFALSGGAMAIFGLLPILILTRQASSYTLGIFAAPYRLNQGLWRFGALVQTSFYPVLADSYANDSGLFMKVHSRFRTVMLSMGLPVSVLGVLFGGKIVGLLLGPEYAESTVVFQVLICVAALRFVRNAYGAAMTAAGYQRAQLRVTAAALLSLVLFYVLVPVADLSTGMATAILMAEAVFLGSMVFTAGRTYLRAMPAGLRGGHEGGSGTPGTGAA